MLKSVLVAGSMFLAASAFAQSNVQKSPGSSANAPGQQMQNTNQPSTAPGASEYAPGHQKNTTAGPGHSESAPGHQTTGSSTTKSGSGTMKK